MKPSNPDMKRPFPVTLTLWMVLSMIIWNAVRAWTSLAWSEILNEFSITPAPIVGGMVGGIWAVIGAILYWGIWQKKAWSVKMLPGVAAGCTVWYWGERLMWQNPRPNLTFAVIVNLMILIVVIIAIKSLSREAYERKSENQKVD